MRCRLLYVVGQLGPGGLERQLYYLLQAMDRDRYNPEVVVWSFRSDETYVRPLQELGVMLHSFPKNSSATSKLKWFRQIVLQIRPEVIHSYTFYTNFAAWFAAQEIATIPIGSFRSDFDYEKKGSGLFLGCLSGRWPRNQICNSYVAAARISQSRRLFVPKAIWVVRNGIDLQTFQKVTLPNSAPTVILAIGSLLPVKRWDRLLVLAAALKARGVDFIMRIAGDGPLRQSLERQAREYNLVSKVQFLGHSDDIPSLLRDAHFLVHASDTEGCPNAVIEAMACSRAVVAMDVGEIRLLVEDLYTGFVVPPGDGQIFADRVMQLITDSELCRRMGEAGRAKVEREFGLDRLITETLEVYSAAGWKSEE